MQVGALKGTGDGVVKVEYYADRVVLTIKPPGQPPQVLRLRGSQARDLGGLLGEAAVHCDIFEADRKAS